MGTLDEIGSFTTVFIRRRSAMRSIIRFMREEEGATAIEYGLIASLIAVAIIGALLALRPKLIGVFQTVADALPAAS
jgi:pilus assembly protein Flp/PilA